MLSKIRFLRKIYKISVMSRAIMVIGVKMWRNFSLKYSSPLDLIVAFLDK